MLWFCFLEGSSALRFWLPQYLFCSEDLPLLVLFYTFFLVLCFVLLVSPSAGRHSFMKVLSGLYLLGALPASQSGLTGIFSGCECEYCYLMSICIALYCYPQRRNIDHVWICTGLVWCVALSVRSKNAVRVFCTEANAKCSQHLFQSFFNILCMVLEGFIIFWHVSS